jgi:hypothetical protein
MLLAQSGAEATILTSLMRSWKMIANQTDRYIAIMKKGRCSKKIGSPWLNVRTHRGEAASNLNLEVPQIAQRGSESSDAYFQRRTIDAT